MRLRHVARRLSGSRRALGIPAPSFFELVYQQAPTGADADLLVALVGEQIGTPSQARAVVAGFDHQRLPTPFTIRLAEDDLIKVTLDEGFVLWLDRRDPSVSAVIVDRRAWEPHISAAVRQILRPGDTFVDVGANVGFHTFLAASIVGPAGAVRAFEPNTENCRLLWLSRQENGLSNVEIHPIALDRTAGLRYLGSHLGSNGGFVDDQHGAVRAGLGTFVAAARLDDIHRGAARLLKIDVEGAEFAVLDGAGELLAAERPYVILEFSAEMTGRVSGVDGFDALDHLVGLGYDLRILDRETGEPRPVTTAAELRASWGDPLRIEDLLLTPRPL